MLKEELSELYKKREISTLQFIRQKIESAIKLSHKTVFIKDKDIFVDYLMARPRQFVFSLEEIKKVLVKENISFRELSNQHKKQNYISIDLEENFGN